MASQDFPFNIMDVVELLHLNIRRRQAGSVYVDCPFCGDRRGKMNVNYVKNVWRCNFCGEYGGMLALYAGVCHTDNSNAYREICDALQTGDISWHREEAGAAGNGGGGTVEVRQSQKADGAEVHRTLSALFGMLTLSAAHKEHLMSEKRGLSEEEIRRLGFKSTPSGFLCPSLTRRLMEQGCTVQGVPGFYRNRQGVWTVKFGSRTSGILIPAVGPDGMVKGAQILLDAPLKDKDDPPDKPGTKYLWFSSSSKDMGTSSGSPVHFVGDPHARTVYVTEGLLKANIAHCLTWNPNYKGIDDWQLALRRSRRKQQEDGKRKFKELYLRGQCGMDQLEACMGQYSVQDPDGETLAEHLGMTDEEYLLIETEDLGRLERVLDAQRRPQGFRVYQLSFSGENRTVPFAFKGFMELRKAGYEQPPAASYRLAYTGEYCFPAGKTEVERLRELVERFNGEMPEDYGGRPLSPSDVLELFDGQGRDYYYLDPPEFVPVRFSPFLAGKTDAPGKE